MSDGSGNAAHQSSEEARENYRRAMVALRTAYEDGALAGQALIAERSRQVDALIGRVWGAACQSHGIQADAAALVATGGYGRQELFPYSDVDLLFVFLTEAAERAIKPAIRSLSEQMWDTGVRFAPATRLHGACERADADNIEFALSLLDARYVAGDELLAGRLLGKTIPRLVQKDAKLLLRGIGELTRARHAKYGDTLFHLEPNIKECPGGLRDVHVVRWLGRLDASGRSAGGAQGEFGEAVAFLSGLRCFLHFRRERDDNTLDWQAQDHAAQLQIGMAGEKRADAPQAVDAAYWMRIYFRNARSVERSVALAFSQVPHRADGARAMLGLVGRRPASEWPTGYEVRQGRVALKEGVSPAGMGSDPDAVLSLFREIARSGVMPGADVESMLLSGLPLLASRLEDGIGLWHRLREILLQRHAGGALRAMHAVGLLDLLLPEFHGIDSLVIRDAYHRYTVDEHTFVLIDTLHGLGDGSEGELAEWGKRFAQVLGELPHAELLYVAALMHDTGKGRSAGNHTIESARMTENVLTRLELEPYEARLVVDLVRNHLEMSSTLRRDIFDAETIRSFAGKVQTQEALRMLLLFTYADLNAVHPDALTPWKAENLWRLYIATSNYLDHSVDDERIGVLSTELMARITANLPTQTGAVKAYLEGFPERYGRTRSADQVRRHFEMAQRFPEDPVQIEFRYSPMVNDLVLVTLDRALLFANVAGVLAAWGMNIVTADAFSNRHGTVVDTFRFTDNFRTLELNESERDRFVLSVRDVVSGRISVEKLLEGRRRSRKKAMKMPSSPTFTFNEEASSHSTLLELVADDTPGLLRALSLTLAAHQCNIEVALVDTEGETAIDVFYLTREGRKLNEDEKTRLAASLVEAVAANAI